MQISFPVQAVNLYWVVYVNIIACYENVAMANSIIFAVGFAPRLFSWAIWHSCRTVYLMINGRLEASCFGWAALIALQSTEPLGPV